MSFRLAARIAAMFDGTVDAVHFSEDRRHDVDISTQAMPSLKPVSDERLKDRALESRRAFRELIAPIAGATFTGDPGMTREQIVTSGRCADLVDIGRSGPSSRKGTPA